MKSFRISNLSNKDPVNIEDFIKHPKKGLDLEKLMTLSDIFLLRFIHHIDEDLAFQIKSILFELNQSSSNSNVHKWVKKTINDHFCKKCKSNQLNREVFPFCLCESCKSSLVHKSKCLSCYRHFKDPDLAMSCGHLCKFCACMWIKKGYESCPECSSDYLQVKAELTQKTFTCSFCEIDKKLYQDTLCLLKCKHLICGQCFASRPTLKACKFDSKAIHSKTRKLFEEYSNETCSLCDQVKPRSKFLNKTCCPAYYQICKKCAGSSTCPLCRNRVTLNQFTS